MEENNQKKPIYKRWWFIALVVFVGLGIIGSVFGGGNAPQTDAAASAAATSAAPVSTTVAPKTHADTKAETTAKEMSGINLETFRAMVEDEIKKIDEAGVIGKIEARLSTAGNDTAYVKLYLANNSAWSSSSAADQKDFVKTMGDIVRVIADLNKYDKSQQVYTSTTILSSAGNELAVDDLTGKITIK